MTDPSGFSLIEIADKIRDRQISSVEVTTILLTRIARCQPVINAFIQVHAGPRSQ
jgi:Asp-tRNA(Asn)/Glu-tRNA(Gln) amidotransferase A subunit family amidase